MSRLGIVGGVLVAVPVVGGDAEEQSSWRWTRGNLIRFADAEILGAQSPNRSGAEGQRNNEECIFRSNGESGSFVGRADIPCCAET